MQLGFEPADSAQVYWLQALVVEAPFLPLHQNRIPRPAVRFESHHERVVCRLDWFRNAEVGVAIQRQQPGHFRTNGLEPLHAGTVDAKCKAPFLAVNSKGGVVLVAKQVEAFGLDAELCQGRQAETCQPGQIWNRPDATITAFPATSTALISLRSPRAVANNVLGRPIWAPWLIVIVCPNSVRPWRAR